MTQAPLNQESLTELFEEYLETEFTFLYADELSIEVAAMPRDKQDFILQWTKSAAAVNSELAFQFAIRAGAVLDQHDKEMIAAWCLEAMDCYDRSGLHAAMETIRDLDEFLRQGYKRASASLYEDAIPVLLPFLHGLSGRRMKIEQDEVAWTDGETLYLPEIMAFMDDETDNFKLYKILVTFLWSQMRFGTLNQPLSEIFTRYEDPEKAQKLFFMLERQRLEAKIAHELPGLYKDIERFADLLGGADVDVRDLVVAELAERHAGLEDTLQWLDLFYSKDCEVPEALCFHGALKPEEAWQARELRLLKEKARLRDSLRVIMEEVEEGAEDRELPSSFEVKESKETPEERLESLEIEITLADQPMPIPDHVKSLLRSVLLDFGEIPPDYLTPAGEGEYDPELLRDKELNPEDVWAGAYHEEGAFLYKEWDAARQSYKKNWCVMRELEIDHDDTGFYRQTMDKYGGHIHSLRQTFEMLRGEDRLLKRQLFGDDVDIDALVEAWGDVCAGREMTQHLFTRMHKDDRNIAVMFMVDMSGSTRGWINEAEREALILMAEALETLGDRYAIYGFSGWTRKRCEVFRVKDFDDDWDDDAKARTCGIEPKDYTRMGVAIRHLSGKLAQVDARIKLLITLSDGKPDDYDLEYRGKYGIEDTRQALLEARRDNIHPFCITIDKEGQDYLPHMYGKANYIVIDEVRNLPVKVSEIYRKLTS